MREIESYLSRVFSEMKIGEREARDIREELRCHLIDSADELTEAGLAESQSIKRAIEQFGEPEVIAHYIESMHAERRLKRRAVGYFSAAVSLILVAAAGLVALKSWHQTVRERSLQQAAVSEKNYVELFRDAPPLSTAEGSVKNPQIGEGDEEWEIKPTQNKIAGTLPMPCLKSSRKGELPQMMTVCMAMMSECRMNRWHDIPNRPRCCCLAIGN